MIDLTTTEFLKLIPNYVIAIAEELQKNNFEAYLVGGSIRDVLLGKVPEDFDIATNAYPEQIEKLFPKSIPTGAQFGTITVVSKDENGESFDVEVTTYRSEADYVGGRWPAKVEFTKTIQEDLSRRDFTINAIALDLQNFDNSNKSVQEILVDPFDGIADIRNKVIRAVRDALERFSEDGLRSVRACRLASQLDFEIEENTFAAINQTLHVTKKVSIERFREELMKMLLRSPKPSKGLRLMKDSGLLELFIPELLEGIGIEQPEYHTFDVWEHCLRCVDIAEDEIKLAALFHDIGKPRCISKDKLGTHFYGHDVKGAEMAREIMKRLKFSNAEIEQVYLLVRWHMFYYPSADWRKVKDVEELLEKNREEKDEHGWTDGAIRRLIKNVGGEENIDLLMKLRIADANANPKNEFHPVELEVLGERISQVRSKDMALKIEDLDITGHDLMQELNLEPGRELGIILNQLLEEVIDDPLKNKKETLLLLAKEILNSKS